MTGRNRGLLKRLLDPAFVSHLAGGTDVGMQAYAAAVDATHAAFADLVVVVQDQIAEGDMVATESATERLSNTGKRSTSSVPCGSWVLWATEHPLRDGAVLEVTRMIGRGSRLEKSVRRLGAARKTSTHNFC